MNLQAVLSKTGKGVEEIQTRQYNLEQKLRAILIVVNGKATAAELVKKFELLGDVTPMIERLIAEGFVAPAAPAADIRELRGELARALLDALGPGAESIAVQIEDCKSVQALRAYVEDRRAMLEGALGKKGAAFWEKAKALPG